jgi:hypothetical protein
MIQLKLNAKDMFFDRPKVMKMMDEAESKAFNRIGGRIRTFAIRGMRSQKKPKKKVYVPRPSAPGQPPKRHVANGSGLSKIWYIYDRRHHRVLIGPLKFNWSEYPQATVPQLHEFGGTVSINEADYSNGWGEPKWYRVGKRGLARARAEKRPVRTRQAKYPARPFMRPALDANQSFILDSWSGASVSVGG